MAQQLSLAWLLRPLTVDAFLDEIWGKSHYHVSRNSPKYFDSLREGADSIDALLAVFRPHLSLVSLVRKAERKHQFLYRLADGGFDVAAIGQDFADGYTIVLEAFSDMCVNRLTGASIESSWISRHRSMRITASQGFVPSRRPRH